MAFPSSIGTKADDLASGWNLIRTYAAKVKADATQLRDGSAAGPIPASMAVSMAGSIATARIMLDRATAIPGIQAYVRSQINDGTFDIAASYTAMIAQMDATRDWIIANFPKDASGFLLYHQLSATGALVIRQLTSAQTATLRTVLDALIATID